MTKIPDWVADVGEGWAKILYDLHSDLQEMFPEYEIGQVKEKFGGLRVYVDTYPEDKRFQKVVDRIEKAELLSVQTCEFCGEPGHPNLPRSGGGWIKTTCKEHQG